MSQTILTPEQEQVIHHPLGYHARVLAVAGSGKSSTMAYRIKNLVEEHSVRPGAIQVLMFNSLARKQFSNTLDKIGLMETRQPLVHTFHSFSFQVIGEAIKRGLLPSNTQFWLADKTELIWLTVKRTISDLERGHRIPPESVDPEEALAAINLWKGSLIPPYRAGSFASPYLPPVYAQFEQVRQLEAALTFDDFVPMAIDLLENNSGLYERYSRDLRHLIIDEYQDINFGQQRLIEILASEQVDIMVVGDDDQTIYEWRGARPNYIIHDFATVFNAQPVKDYRLSRSFRFGPIIAQCAANVIACNSNRVEKPLIAYQANKPGFVQIFDGGYDSIKALTEQVVALTQVDKVPPSQVIVLARLFAQLDNLEAEFLSRNIPYRVDGQAPFYKRKEINTLLDYVRLARDYAKPIDDKLGDLLISVANKPSRMLSRQLLSSLINQARQRSLSTGQMLEMSISNSSFGVTRWQVNHLQALSGFLGSLQTLLTNQTQDAGDLLSWMIKELDYLTYFRDYYGKGESSDEKAYAVVNFVRYVKLLHTTPFALLDQLAKLDTTRGKPEEELITFTTIFRTKGLEFDYVVIPQCDENLLPYLKGERSDVFDTKGLVKESQMSSKLESERRLFYVAITRARKGVLIGSSANPSRFLDEIRLQETESLMNAIQWIATGNNGAKGDLLKALQNRVINPITLQNLVNGYLTDMNQTRLAAEISRIHLATTPI